MARAKNGGRKPAKINPLNEDLAGAGDGLAHAAFGPPPGPGAVALTAGQLTYTQNFDALASSGATGTSLPADWTFSETGGAAPTTYSVGTGSGTTGDTWSFGIAGTNPVTDRAFGSLASTTVTQILIGASFANMSGAAITAILISYVGEQWRRGGNTVPDRLDFQISFNATSLTSGSWTDVNGLDFVSISTSASALTLDGNAAANRLAVSFNIAGVNIANGGTFWIRWIDTNIAGNDDGLAIDNFSLTATINRPPVVAAAIPDHHGNEDEAVLYTVPANSFSDPDGNPLTYAARLADDAPLPAWLIFTAATRTFSGTPPANFNGTLSVKVIASDGSFSVSDIFSLVIDPVNDGAVIGGTDTGAVTEDGGLTASGQLTISDVDGGESSFQPVAAGTAGANGHGMFEMRADGGWTYTLDNDDPDVQALHAVDTLADTITVLAADGTAHLLGVTIHGANEASAAPYARAGDEALVNSSVAGLHSQPSVAFLAGGRYVVVFQVFDGDQFDVRGRIFNRDGSPAGPDFSVNIAAGGEQHLPQVAALVDGGFVVVWQDSAGGTYDIMGRIYEADGSAGGEIPIIAALANETAPAVAGLPGGGFVMLWIDDSDADGDVLARIFLADGSPAGDAFAVNAPAAGGQVHAAVTVLAGGTIVAVWEDGAAGDVRMRLFSAAGVALTAEITANGGPAGSQGAPCVVALTGGGYAVAWMDGGADGDGYGIYARLFEADGDPAGAEFRVNTLAAGDQMAPSIAALPDGGFVVSWADGAGPDADDIRAQRFDADGVPVDAEFVVNGNADGVQSQPAMAANMYGTLVVAWNDASSPGIGGDDDGAVAHVLLTPGGAPPAGPTAAIIGGEDSGAVIEDSAPATSGTLTITDPDAGQARLVAQTDAAGSNGYGRFRIDAGGTWTYSIAGSALADTIPGGETRTDTIIVSAIDGTTHAVTVTITGTNDAPVVTATAGTIAYSESVDTAPGSIAVDAALTLADADDIALVGATVSISGNFQAGQDILAFDNDDAAAFGNIGAVYDAGSGVLTLASAGGAATLAQWQAALRAVTYSNGSEEPGEAVRTIRFTVDDGDAASAVVTRLLSVAAQNDSPSGANSTVTIDEDSTFIFTAAHFGFTDVDGDAFAGVRFGAAPAGGTLYFDAVAVSGFPTIIYSAADIAAGKLAFVPTADLNGTGAASVGFTVVDNGGTAGAGQNADTTPNTLAFDMTPVNDAPVNGVPDAQAVDEDASLFFSTANGNALSVADVDATQLTVTLSVAHGTLTLASTAGLTFADGDATMTFTGTAAAINAALGAGLTYAPAADYNGGDTLCVITSDDGPLTDADTVAIAIAPVNDAPAGTSAVFTVDEDMTFTFNAGHFGFSDAADGDNFLGVVIAAIPVAGAILLDAAALVAGIFVSAADIALGRLTFVPVPDAYGVPYGSLTFQVRDDGGTGNGGQDTDQGPDMITFDVAARNDAPAIAAPGGQTINEDASLTLSTGNGNAISVADIDSTTLTVTLSVAHGMLTLASTADLSFSGGSDGTIDATMTFSGTAAAINAALGAGLTYNPTADYDGPDSIAVLATDNGETGTGGTLQDDDVIAITVNSVNDAPSGANNMVTGSEHDPLVFTAADFGFGDPAEGHMLLAVRITAAPLVGQLRLNGAAVNDGDFIPVAEIAAGHLTFHPALDQFGDNYAGFTFQVQDDGGVLNGGVDLDQSPNLMTIDITPDNLPPAVDLDGATAGVNYATTFVEDGAAVAIGSGVAVTDPNSGIGDLIESATITLTDWVADDSLTLTGVPPPGITAVTTPSVGSITITITGPGTGAQYQALIQSILYATTNQDPTVGGTDLARTVTVTVNDGLVDSAVATTTVNITAVDDAPQAVADSFTVTESGMIVAGNLFANDIEPDGPALTVSAVSGGPGANVGTQFTLDSGALLTVHADGTFDYDPNGVFLRTPTPGSGASNTPGHDSFAYTLAGGDTVTVGITLTGLDTDDTLLGTTGTDILAGGSGDDWYFVENGTDQVVEGIGLGNDRLFASVSYALTAGSEVELLTTDWHIGTDAIDLTGNALANIIFGNDGDNVLKGGAGADTLVGRAGNDLFFVDNAGDVVIEQAGEGNDRVFASASYTLAAGIDVEMLTTDWHIGIEGIDLTGNALANTIYGNDGDNKLDGGAGADALVGRAGNDWFFVDNAGDRTFEAVGDGNDRVFASTSYTLIASAEVELLTTDYHAGTAAIDLTGNDLANAIYGNAGSNVLDGKGGNDGLLGNGGADTFAFTTALGAGNVDTIFDFASGTDKIALDDAVFTAIGGTLKAGAFVIGGTAADADDRIVYNSATGQLFYDADGSGLGVQVLFATLQAGTSLTASDFQMI